MSKKRKHARRNQAKKQKIRLYVDDWMIENCSDVCICYGTITSSGFCMRCDRRKNSALAALLRVLYRTFLKSTIEDHNLAVYLFDPNPTIRKFVEDLVREHELKKTK